MGVRSLTICVTSAAAGRCPGAIARQEISLRSSWREHAGKYQEPADRGQGIQAPPDDAFEKVCFSEGGAGPLIKDADMTPILGLKIPKLCYVEATYSDTFTERYRWFAQHNAWGLEAS